MNGIRLPSVGARVGTWFQHGVEERLEDAVGGPARLRVVVLLACVLGLDSADKATVGAVAGPLESALHIGNTDIGLLVTVSTAVGALATLPVGVFADRVHRVRLLVAAIVVWSAAMVVSGAANSFVILLLTRLALGAVVAAAGPVVASLVGDLFPAAERGRIYGFILTGELIGAGIGFLAAGQISSALSWRWAFWLLALPGLVLAWLLARMLPEPARNGQSRLEPGDESIRTADDVERGSAPAADREQVDAATSEVAEKVARAHVRPRDDLVLQEDPTGASLWWAVKYVLAIPTNRTLIVASALGYFFFAGLRTFAVVFLQGRFGLGEGAASALLVTVGAGAVVGVLIAGRAADHLIGRRQLAARPIVGGVSFLVAVVLFTPSLLVTSLLAAAPLMFLAAAGLGGANPPLDAARLDLLHSRLWGRSEAVRTVFRSSLEAAAPLLFGWVSEQFGAKSFALGHPTGSAPPGANGLDETFLIMLVPLLVAGVLLLVFARRTYPRDVASAVSSERTTARRRKRAVDQQEAVGSPAPRPR